MRGDLTTLSVREADSEPIGNRLYTIYNMFVNKVLIAVKLKQLINRALTKPLI